MREKGLWRLPARRQRQPTWAGGDAGRADEALRSADYAQVIRLLQR